MISLVFWGGKTGSARRVDPFYPPFLKGRAEEEGDGALVENARHARHSSAFRGKREAFQVDHEAFLKRATRMKACEACRKGARRD
ncbi:hypothetical protein A2U01_0032082, partial [Trifolium medium]|nr:hypothetical protein [Trifolium medium]